MTTLIIVESPGKVKKISQILGQGYKVVASVGHVRDLPSKGSLGFEPPNFHPEYVPTERGKDVLKRLRADVKAADRVLLATDPDREGEAISWHLADALGLKNPERITFGAITKKDIMAAVSSPRKIDMDLVKAQEARRVLDRIVGFKVSGAVSNSAGERLSAGRVQSPAVRIIVDREQAISDFKVTDHYGVEIAIGKDDAAWRAEWDTKPCLPDGQEYILDRALAEKVAASSSVTVAEVENGERRRAPAAPFTTSTLQQVAGSKLKIKPKKTMELAQKLYEQGAITYHRTDAPNMSEEGIADIAAYAAANNLPLSDKKRKWKAKEGAQEGHEAIRPTHVEDEAAGTTSEEKALYGLIRSRAIASQLADAVYSERKVRLSSDVDGETYFFNAKGSVLVDAGWLGIFGQSVSDDDQVEAANPIPDVEEGQGFDVEQAKVLEKHTKPPARFTQASLVKEMERLGIGRPSTYAAILDNITARDYVSEDKKGFLSPTATGKGLIKLMVGVFSFVNIDYTRKLEDVLDAVSQGKETYLSVVSEAWSAVESELGKLPAGAAFPSSREVFPCPSCNNPLRLINGKKGAFFACTAADCSVTLPERKGKPVVAPCPSCGRPMRRIKGNSGWFWSCSGYPECRVTMEDKNGLPVKKESTAVTSDYKCKDCGKVLIHRKGKTAAGKEYDFYGCSGYPDCKKTYKTGEDGKPIFE